MESESVGVSNPLHMRWIKVSNKTANDDFNVKEKPKSKFNCYFVAVPYLIT